MAEKLFELAYSETGKTTIYGIILQRATGYYLNDATGLFASAPSDKFLAATEHAVLKGIYRITESRSVWPDGEYLCVWYDKAGGSEDPATDPFLGTTPLNLAGDVEVPAAPVTILTTGFPITYYGTEGQTGLYARIKRISDGRFWSVSGSAWVDSESAVCNVPLTESLTGKYTGTAALTPRPGAKYEIAVYTSLNALLLTTRVMSAPSVMTALQIVQEIQKELRLPQSTDFTDSHAKLVLSFINNVLVNILADETVWDDLKVAGTFKTVVGVSIYPVMPANVDYVEVIRDLRVAGKSYCIGGMSDEKFRVYRAENTTPGEPRQYRREGRSGGMVFIEVCPVPDAIYSMDFEILQRPPRLTLVSDIPIVDAETVLLGAKVLAKESHGRSFDLDLPVFQAKKSSQTVDQGSANWGDAETV